MPTTEQLRKLIFMSYQEILDELKKKNIMKKNGEPLERKDLEYAVQVMQNKHSLCRWRSEKIKKNYYYIPYEGYLWLRDVYFTNYDKKFIEKDIVWFKNRIQWYQNQFIKKKIDFKPFQLKYPDMNKTELMDFFNRSKRSIEIALQEYEKLHTFQRTYNKKNELVISSDITEWLVKNKFKQKYLDELEKYKMYLTEIYKANGGYYDNYFGRN